MQLISIRYGKWIIILLVAGAAAVGWLGYSVWRTNSIEETTGWRTANDEMKRLLEQQTEERMNKNQPVGQVPSASGKQVDGTIKPSGSPDSRAADIADAGAVSGSSANTGPGPIYSPGIASVTSGTDAAEPEPADPLPAASISKPAAQKKTEAGLIHLNKATEGQLITIPGIGASKAKAIIAHRKQIGRYQSMDQLLDVKGIGEKLLDKMKPYLLIDP